MIDHKLESQSKITFDSGESTEEFTLDDLSIPVDESFICIRDMIQMKFVSWLRWETSAGWRFEE